MVGINHILSFFTKLDLISSAWNPIAYLKIASIVAFIAGIFTCPSNEAASWASAPCSHEQACTPDPADHSSPVSSEPCPHSLCPHGQMFIQSRPTFSPHLVSSEVHYVIIQKHPPEPPILEIEHPPQLP
ncbi:MAG: hypothetical protein NZM04_05860 [Methylacidiphilales bacterium]|nr:hypothetical protein [Candidatus Methylacidiphilales bacterium]MDW8350062.1 hypothetical protein [Verrucomicrobiae bacterium]